MRALDVGIPSQESLLVNSSTNSSKPLNRLALSGALCTQEPNQEFDEK